MPTIRPSSELRNNYNEISSFCHTYEEPVYLTKNGKGDLAVMSIETYERLASRMELYDMLMKGLDDIENDRIVPVEQAFEETRAMING